MKTGIYHQLTTIKALINNKKNLINLTS